MTAQHMQVIVLGGGYAGLLAAVRLAGRSRGTGTRITLVNAADTFVERLRLHQLAAGAVVHPRPMTDTLRGTGVAFVRGLATQIDPVRRALAVQTEAGVVEMRYDKLLYAPGSTIDLNGVPGAAAHAYALTPTGPRSAPALAALLPQVAARQGRLIIGGGGATGIEAAAEFADAYPGLTVRLITREPLGAFTSERVADYLRRSLVARGVILDEQTTIAEIQADAVATTDGMVYPYDVCLWTGGFAVPALAREAGLAVNERGQLLLDPLMRSISHSDVYGAGDAAYPVETPGAPVRMSAYTAAVMGAHAADCLAAVLRGRTPKPFSFAYMGQGIALGRRNAIGFGNYPDDVPKGPYFTGEAGHQMRDFFVRLLADLPRLERRMPGLFWWRGKGLYAARDRAGRLRRDIVVDQGVTR